MCNTCKLKNFVVEVMDTMQSFDCSPVSAHIILGLFWQYSYLFDCDCDMKSIIKEVDELFFTTSDNDAPF